MDYGGHNHWHNRSARTSSPVTQPWPAHVPSWLAECLRLAAWCMPAPSGQIPPPRAWWENEAPAARAACSSSQAAGLVVRGVHHSSIWNY